MRAARRTLADRLAAGRLLNAVETAERLGVSERTVYNLAKGGRLRPVVFGSRMRFRLDDVRRLAEEKHDSDLARPFTPAERAAFDRLCGRPHRCA